MKNIFKFCLLVWAVAFYSCDDPYKDQIFTVSDKQPISSYLETRPDDFSEWIKVLEYADMYNAINMSGTSYTAFVPNNKAVKAFYAQKNVSSIEELDKSYARQLVQFHVVNDSTALDKLVAGGELDVTNLLGDHLEIAFLDTPGQGEGFGSSIYVNGEAHVSELSISTSNGLVYVLDDVLQPLLQGVYGLMKENGKNKILSEAIELTGWRDSLNIIADTTYTKEGARVVTRRYYTLLAVSDAVYQEQGIASVQDLASKLGAGNDYEERGNALNRYVAYHILEGRYKVTDLEKTEMESLPYKLWTPVCDKSLIKISKEADGNFYLNYDEGNLKARLVKEGADFTCKNGYIQQIDGYLPISTNLKPVLFYWDPASYSELGNYIASNGADGQLFQQGQGADNDKELRTELSEANLSCYQFTYGPEGKPSSNYGNLAYHTIRTKEGMNYDDRDPAVKVFNEDLLNIAIGYKGTLVMNSPALIPGKYKVTLRYFYANSMRYFRWFGRGSNGGVTTFQFTDAGVASVPVALYSSLPNEIASINASTGEITYKTKQGLQDVVLYDTFEVTEMREYPFKITIDDPGANNSADYRVQIDYILFEPIND